MTTRSNFIIRRFTLTGNKLWRVWRYQRGKQNPYIEDRQQKSEKNKDKRTNNNLQNITQKLKIIQNQNINKHPYIYYHSYPLMAEDNPDQIFLKWNSSFIEIKTFIYSVVYTILSMTKISVYIDSIYYRKRKYVHNRSTEYEFDILNGLSSDL